MDCRVGWRHGNAAIPARLPTRPPTFFSTVIAASAEADWLNTCLTESVWRRGTRRPCISGCTGWQHGPSSPGLHFLYLVHQMHE